MKKIHKVLTSACCASLIGMIGFTGSSNVQHADAATENQAFQQSCAACHGADLISGRAPDLIGENFKNKYMSEEQLYNFIKGNMPPKNPGSLSDAEYKAIAAYILEKNSTATAAPATISVKINGKAQAYDQPPMIVKGRTLVPLRGIFESLGATVKWDGNTQTITATKGSTSVTIKVGAAKATINGKSVALEAPATIVKGRTLVPARFVSEALGANVEWDAKSRTVLITTH